MRNTRTYAVLPISPAAYREVRQQLEAAGYQHAFHEHEGEEVIDMHGIALAPEDTCATPEMTWVPGDVVRGFGCVLLVVEERRRVGHPSMLLLATVPNGEKVRDVVDAVERTGVLPSWTALTHMAHQGSAELELIARPRT